MALVACSGTSSDDDVIARVDAGTAGDAGVVEGPCESWLVEFDLNRSQFEVREVIGDDRTNDIGPGKIVIRYPDESGARVDGPVTIVDYMLTIQFEETGVQTDIMTFAGPNECGLAQGVATSTTITWSGRLADHHSRGTVTCNGEEIVCAFAMLPRGEPQRRDSDRELPLSAFRLGADGSLDSDFAEITTGEDVGRTFLKLRGTETSSRCVPLPTSCP